MLSTGPSPCPWLFLIQSCSSLLTTFRLGSRSSSLMGLTLKNLIPCCWRAKLSSWMKMLQIMLQHFLFSASQQILCPILLKSKRSTIFPETNCVSFHFLVPALIMRNERSPFASTLSMCSDATMSGIRVMYLVFGND